VSRIRAQRDKGGRTSLNGDASDDAIDVDVDANDEWDVTRRGDRERVRRRRASRDDSAIERE